MTGEIVENKVSKWRIWGAHGEGLVGMVFSIIGIGVALAVTYIDALRPDFFTSAWDTDGLPLVLLTVGSSLASNLLRFLFGNVQIVRAAEFVVNLIGAFATLSLYNLFPFDLTGDFEQGMKVFLIFAIIVSTLTALSNLAKTINWNPADDVSIHKTR